MWTQAALSQTLGFPLATPATQGSSSLALRSKQQAKKLPLRAEKHLSRVSRKFGVSLETTGAVLGGQENPARGSGLFRALLQCHQDVGRLQLRPGPAARTGTRNL